MTPTHAEIKPQIVLIAAIGRNRELGVGPDLIWKTKGDMQRFKGLTLGHPIVMGRKTFDSIGHPLPNRINIVVTRDTTWSYPGVLVAHSLEEAFHSSAELQHTKIFVIGGGEIYKAALPYATRLELTLVDAEEPKADIFFPPYMEGFKETKRENPVTEDGVRYEWVTFDRKT
jgi:dihydrofolate reductase